MGQEIIRIDLGGVNCYLGKNDDNYVLFDTGGHLFIDKQFSNRRECLEEELNKAGCGEGNLKLVLLTHGDCDHSANASFIRDKYKVKIGMHKGDLDLVEKPDIDKVLENCKYRSIIFKIVFMLIKNRIRKITQKTLEDFESFKPDFFVDEGFDLKEYGFDAKVIHIPGHTDGSIGILTSDGELISGDVFSNMKKPDLSPNASDFKALISSVGRLKKMNINKVYPGHGEPFEAGNFLI